MTRLIQRGGGFLAGWLARPAQRDDDPALHDDATVAPSQSLDHPTYLRRGIAISGMALPASGTGRTMIRAASV